MSNRPGVNPTFPVLAFALTTIAISVMLLGSALAEAGIRLKNLAAELAIHRRQLFGIDYRDLLRMSGPRYNDPDWPRVEASLRAGGLAHRAHSLCAGIPS